MAPKHRINPKHGRVRGPMRIIGPLMVVVGAIFFLVGIVDFFGAMGKFGRSPELFWCLFIGMILGGIGLKISTFAYLGAMARYMSQETAPVAKDTINYMVDETEDSIKKVASAIGSGIAAGSGQGPSASQESQTRCQRCDSANDADAKFCDNCGAALPRTRSCSSCGEVNDPDARFCDNCGQRLR
jgi:hypothetical protein